MTTHPMLSQLADHMETSIVGKRPVIELALITLLSGGHLLLEDVPGVGKTTLARTLSRAIECSFSRIQFTPDTLPGDVTGLSIYRMQTGAFEYIPGVVMNDIVLADEINRTSPKTQASLLEAMEERQVTVDGISYPLPELFMVIATQNPVEQLGTYRLPEAQLDRFMMKLSMGYPDKSSEEADLIKRQLSGQAKTPLSPIMKKPDFLTLIREASETIIHDDLYTYITELIRSTRKSKALLLGASPRAAIALSKAARSRAFFMGRHYVLPEDVQVLLEPVLLHRLLLTPEARLEGIRAKDVLAEAIRSVKVPVL